MRNDPDYNKISKNAVDDWLGGAAITDIVMGDEILEGTEATPPQDLLKYQIINCRSKVFYYLDDYYMRKNYANQNNPKVESLLKTAIMMLFHNVRASMTKDDPLKVSKVDTLLSSNHVKFIIMAFTEIDQWLYEKKLTSFDGKPRVNQFSTEARNKVNGL
jgi:hypothetical protein